eukprot:7324811-Prymnesium_polylepis.1
MVTESQMATKAQVAMKISEVRGEGGDGTVPPGSCFLASCIRLLTRSTCDRAAWGKCTRCGKRTRWGECTR